MAFDTGISTAIQQYVYTQSNGAVTQPVNISYIQAYCEFLGVTQPVNASWLIALCNHFGITEPLNGSYTIALANYYGITTPAPYDTWWMALAFQAYVPPFAPFIWNLDTELWEAETRVWEWTIPQVPVADFTSDAVTVFVGSQVQFTDTSLYLPTSWAWTFTGAVVETSTQQNPLVTYDTVGSFQVVLEATNAEGSNTKTVPNYMTVNVVPVVADFSADQTSPIEGGTVAFTDLSTGTPTEWDWTLTGATPSASPDQNPSVVYSTAGTYSVSLTASKTGSTDTITKVDYITVYPPSVVEPITEFATGLYYQSISNPLSRVEFSNTLYAQKIQTTI
tara:strand:+ start:159 stop:1163 length:1005 start_codon:yes stop_codon:yes gene_type:complete